MASSQVVTVVGRDVPMTELQLRDVPHSESSNNQQRTTTSAPIPAAEEQARLPTLKLIAAGFSFFSAGVNDGTLGPLVPYILRGFAIGTGEIAVLYALTFAGWLLAAAANPFLTPRLKLGQLLALGAALQLIAQCARPWGPVGLYFSTFFLQALGMGFQDSHSNTFVTSVKAPHRWLGFIHAMYALGLLVSPLFATAIASSQTATADGWRRVYFVLIGVGVVNLVGVVVGFRDSMWGRSAPAPEEGGPSGGSGKNKIAFKESADVLKQKTVWLVSLFYFFHLGTTFTAGGWVVEYLTTVRQGDLAKMGYVPTGFNGGVLLGRLLLAEPTHRFGEKRMLLFYSAASLGLQLVFWLVPNIAASAVSLSLMGFFFGPFFPAGISVASKLFPRKIQAAALGFVFVLAQAGGAIFPSVTGVIATHAGVAVLQPMVTGLIVATALAWVMVPKANERRQEA